MASGSYALPTALIFTIGGLITWLAGYRFFRFVLALNGFILGAVIGSSAASDSNTFVMLFSLLVGGIVGAFLMVVAYYVAVGLVGAGLAATVLHYVWKLHGGDPPTLLLVIVCVIGAVMALQVVRYVMVVGTSVAGSWMFLVGVLALTGDPRALTAASAPNVFVVYPVDLLPPNWWVMMSWIVLSVVGITVQLRTTTPTGQRKKKIPAS